jgi:hypothetical protein
MMSGITRDNQNNKKNRLVPDSTEISPAEVVLREELTGRAEAADFFH